MEFCKTNGYLEKEKKEGGESEESNLFALYIYSLNKIGFTDVNKMSLRQAVRNIDLHNTDIEKQNKAREEAQNG